MKMEQSSLVLTGRGGGVNDFSEVLEVSCHISKSFTTGFNSALKRPLKQDANLSPKGLTAFLFSDVEVHTEAAA